MVRDASTVPAELQNGPFTVAKARSVGVTWIGLQSRGWVRLSRGQYAWAGLRPDICVMLRGVHERMPDAYAFSGRTAAWIWGLDLPPCEPVEVTVDRNIPIRARAGVRLTRASLPPYDVTDHLGFRTTTVMRTVRDLGSRKDQVESVVAIDMALHSGLVDAIALDRYVGSCAGMKGIRRLRRAVRLADSRSESPMETRLRMELVKGRLPNPCVQTELHDATGRFLGRVDLYYPDRRLAIEYDGGNHRDRFAADLKRQNALVNAGYHVLRFTAADFRVRGSIAAQVRQARRLLRPTPR